MAVHTNHPMTMRLDHCWVCSESFIDVGGSAQREIHHIIPVAYGGVNGPTVDLCDTHHSCLHKLALAVRGRKPYMHIFGTDDPEMRTKLMWLANQVNKAQAATVDDPNKKSEVTVVLDHKAKTQLKALLQITPQCKGREQMFKYALDQLYRRTFLKP